MNLKQGMSDFWKMKKKINFSTFIILFFVFHLFVFHDLTTYENAVWICCN